MLQLKMIDKVKEHASDTDNVSAVLMYGSFIKGEGDQYSDIEFYIFHHGQQIVDKREWIAQISPVDLFFMNEFGTEVAIFSNMIRGEFHFHPIADVSVVKTWQGQTSFEYRDNMLLVDKEGKLKEVLDSIQSPLRPVHNTEDEKEFIAQNLLNNLLFERNLLLRKEYAHAHQLFWFVQRYILWMIRIHLSKEEHWESPTKKLEEDLPAEWYCKYKSCVPILDEQSLLNSFSSVLKISDELFTKLNIPVHIHMVLYKIKL